MISMTSLILSFLFGVKWTDELSLTPLFVKIWGIRVTRTNSWKQGTDWAYPSTPQPKTDYVSWSCTQSCAPCCQSGVKEGSRRWIQSPERGFLSVASSWWFRKLKLRPESLSSILRGEVHSSTLTKRFFLFSTSYFSFLCFFVSLINTISFRIAYGVSDHASFANIN